jgi:putative transposase
MYYVSPRRLNYIRVEAGPADRVFYKNRYWLTREHGMDGHHLQAENDPEVWDSVTHAELYHAIKDGDAKVTPGYHSKEQSRLRKIVGDRTLEQFNPQGVEIARHKVAMFKKLEDYVVCNRGKMPTYEKLDEVLLSEWCDQANIARAKAKRDNDYSKDANPKVKTDASKEKAAKARKAPAEYSNKGTATTYFVKPTAKTFLASYHEYLACDGDLRSMIPRHHGPGQSRLNEVDPESYGMWLRYAYEFASSRKPKMKKLRLDCCAEIEKINDERSAHGRSDLLSKPGRKRFENLIRKLDAYEVMAAREGIAKARAFFRAQMSGFDIVRPGERIEFDSYLLELQTWLTASPIWQLLTPESQAKLVRKRIWVIMGRDAATGYIPAIKGSLVENSESVISTLDMALSDKSHISRLVGAETDWYGGVVFQDAYADNGKPYIAERTHDAFRSAGVNLTHPPAGQPWHRGFIESIFAIISEHLLSYFDGRTFSDVGAKGDYPAEEMATLTSDEAIALIIRAVLDYYHHRINPRTGETPHNAWVRYLEETGVTYDVDPHKRRNVFGVKMKAKIQADGMYVWGVRYQSALLQTWRQKLGQIDFPVRFHKEDLRWISVKTPDGWINVENRICLKEPVSVYEWIAAKQNAEADARFAQEPFLQRMNRALNDLRASGDAAALRAAITPHMLRERDILNRHNELFDGLKLSAEEDQVFEVESVTVADDPLHHGGIAARQLRGPLSTEDDATEEEDPLDDEEDDFVTSRTEGNHFRDGYPNVDDGDGDDDNHFGEEDEDDSIEE